MHWLALAVLGHVLEARQIADGRLHVGRAEHQITRFHRRGRKVGTRRQHASVHLRVVGLERLGDLAQHLERHRVVDRTRCGARAAIEHIGQTLELAKSHHLAHQADALAHLTLHLVRDLRAVLVHVHHAVRHSVQRRVLLHRGRHINRSERVRAGRHAFLRQVRRRKRGIRAIGRADESVVHAAVGQPAAKHHRVAGVLGHLLLRASDTQHLHRHGGLEDFTLELRHSGGLGVESLHRHF